VKHVKMLKKYYLKLFIKKLIYLKVVKILDLIAILVNQDMLLKIFFLILSLILGIDNNLFYLEIKIKINL